MKNIMTVEALKEHLQNIIDNLDQFEDNEELKIVDNTYFLKNGQNFIAIENVGFIDLDTPVDMEECEWCGDLFSRRELLNTREYGCLCEQCKDYLDTMEQEKIHVIDD